MSDVFKEFDWLLVQVTLDYGYDLDSCPKWYKELWLQNQAKKERTKKNKNREFETFFFPEGAFARRLE